MTKHYKIIDEALKRKGPIHFMAPVKFSFEKVGDFVNLADFKPSDQWAHITRIIEVLLPGINEKFKTHLIGYFFDNI